MKIERHGLSIGIDRVDDEFLIFLRVTGKLTHDDYAVITPMLESALAGVETPKMRVFVDGTEMEGWAPRAAWDDLKLGLKHGREFEKIALVGNKKWQQFAAKVGSWFISGDVRNFDDESEAMSWLRK